MYLPDKLKNIMSQRKYIFYQWFGYSPQLYSLLYSLQPSVYININNIYQELLKSSITELNVYTVSKITDNIRLWNSVLPHIIDFVNTDEWNQSIEHKKDIV